MRKLIILLVVANAVLFLWQQFVSDADDDNYPVAVQPLPEKLEPLVLLREHDAAPEVTEDTSAIGIPVDNVGAVEETNEPPRDVGSSDIQSMPPTESTPDTTPATAAGESLGAEADSGNCVAVGPFRSVADADKAAFRIRSFGLESTPRSALESETGGYLVLLPPMTREEAARITAQLEGSGVTDFFIGAQNFISLGLYGQRSSAERRQADLRALGYRPEIQEQTQAVERFWLVILDAKDDALAAVPWASLLEDFPGAGQARRDCAAIASPQVFP